MAEALKGIQSIVALHPVISSFTCSLLIYLDFFIRHTDFPDYLLNMVKALKSLEMITEYLWKDIGINWRYTFCYFRMNHKYPKFKE